MEGSLMRKGKAAKIGKGCKEVPMKRGKDARERAK